MESTEKYIVNWKTYVLRMPRYRNPILNSPLPFKRKKIFGKTIQTPAWVRTGH